MLSQDYQPARLFTIEQANAMLPLVRAITTDLARLGSDVMERRHRLALVAEGRKLKPGDPYSDELAHMRDELEKDQIKLREYVEELQELGVEPKGAIEGLVDFPCLMDGRVVYLCWKLGEPEVLYWHDLESGFAGRQSLTADSVSGDFGDDASESLDG
ncbi:MAG TPA: DUF2203 domain-containing protein [Pirellulaceae bacterium]|nr:DUF2203 domain-containing protein [Pirellulaceae bacterium]